MRQLVKSLLPAALVPAARRAYRASVAARYRMFGHPPMTAECSKARPRREQEGFFRLYCQGQGLDVGFGGDLITPTATGYDFEHGDAQYLEGLADASFDFVHASHVIEHMVDPAVALHNWWRVVKPGGHLLLYLPHRDLYEKKTTLPSRWNADHKHFFLVDRDELPVTIGVRPLLERSLPGGEIVYVRECRAGHTVTDPLVHSDGEYSIEAVVRKGRS